MMIKNNILILLCVGLMASCQSAKKVSDLETFPVVPEFVAFSKRPILEKIDNNYLVTDEFIKRATQEHEFVEKVVEWKTVNELP